jgi:hypothetical protein
LATELWDLAAVSGDRYDVIGSGLAWVVVEAEVSGFVTATLLSVIGWMAAVGVSRGTAVVGMMGADAGVTEVETGDVGFEAGVVDVDDGVARVEPGDIGFDAGVDESPAAARSE